MSPKLESKNHLIDYLRTLFRQHPLFSALSLFLNLVMGITLLALLSNSWVDPGQFSRDSNAQRGYLYAYTFSALAQCLAAILGFLGIFVVYRLEKESGSFAQAETSEKRNRREDLKNIAFPLALSMTMAVTLSLLLIGRSDALGNDPFLNVKMVKLDFQLPIIGLVFALVILLLGQIVWLFQSL